MILHHIEINRQGADVPTEERYQRVSTFTEDQLGEAIDSAARIGDAFCRMFNSLHRGLDEVDMDHASKRAFLLRTKSGRKIAYIHVVTERITDLDVD